VSGGLQAQAAAENFPVAGRLLPPRLRRDLTALYGFARSVDDIGDEGPTTGEQRLAALDEVDADLDRLFTHQPARLGFVAGLTATVAEHDLPREPFERLVAANRQDQSVTRYATWDQLREYCRLSADPVGRLVLAVTGSSSPERVAASDRICTALQVLEHLQDVAEDAHAGRIYLPEQDMRRFGVDRQNLTAPTASRPLRALVAFEAVRARDLLESGSELVGALHGAARLAVSGFVAGGLATLRALSAAGWDVLAQPVRPSRRVTMTTATGLLVHAARRGGR